ncbi:hypothetical protein BHM03_00053381 [Ensete ventricosum]|nr:hypothetical protein BHM03_00053381 [Ensete ventricosum]
MTLGLVVMDVATARHGSKTPRWLEGASEKEELAVEGIRRRGWLTAIGAEVMLHLGSSKRRRCRLMTTGVSATPIATTGDCLAATEVAGREEQQLLQIWGASVHGREQRLWLATVIVGAGVDGSDRWRRSRLRGSSSGSGWELLLMEEKAAYACNDKGGRRGSGQTASWKERSYRSDLVIVARDNDG